MITYKDVSLAYLMQGIDAVAALREEGASDDVFHKAFESLSDSGTTDVTTFEAWLGENFDLSTGPGRGRPGPEVGKDRVYRAQKVGDGEPFIRLPVRLLGGDKGTQIRVRFENDQAVVSRA